MRKLGILTFHRTINYGGVLQAYALKRICEELGAKCEIINHKNTYIDSINRVKLFDFRSLKIFVNELLSYKFKKNKKNKFVRFRNEYLTPSGNIDKGIENEFDAFICGSDQVWNYMLSDFDKTYFLDFISDAQKKYSYSASFGFSKIPKDLKSEYKKLLGSFNKISVREYEGATIVKDLIDKDVPVVLDPTLLLSRVQWEKEFSLNNSAKNKYILLYLMIPEPNILRFVEELSKQTGYEIIYITSKLKKTINATYVREVSPIEWVELFMDAEFIVTNSFHGVAFSINFNKEFFMGLLPEPSKVNSRLENALKLFNLEERRINSDSKPSDFNSIDYDPVNNILRKERDKSIGFLKSIIEETHE